MICESFFLPADGVDTDIYKSRVNTGARVARELHVCFGLLMRDVEKHVPFVRKAINLAAPNFARTSVCVFENDSKDNTPLILEVWGEEKNVHIKSEKRKTKKWASIRDPRRGNDMAEYRNELREMMLKTKADLYVVLDADVAGWSLEGMIHSLSYLRDWNICASNGLRKDATGWVQADAWAFRLQSWDPMPFSHVKGIVPRRGDPLMRVRSAFGGMTLYDVSAFSRGKYYGGDCEHVTFHKTIAGVCVLNPSQIVVYKW